MKKHIHLFFFLIIASFGANAQELAANQNPNYTISRDRYMQIADSMNAYHSITVQDTYKAIDFLADRREAREQRRQWRHELRMERARYGGYYYTDYDYNTPYYNNYYSPYSNYNYRYYRYNRGWGGNNFYRNALPLAVTLGTIAWWWCR